MGCPRCNSTNTKTLTAAGKAPARNARVECVKCGRFVRWEAARSENHQQAGNESAPAKPDNGQSTSDVSEEIGSPQVWLYVSRRLELEWLPNDQAMWRVPVVSLNRVPYYRLTAGVLVWLEAAGERLQREFEGGKVDRGQVDEYVVLMGAVWAFALENLSKKAVDDMRGKVPWLPEHEGPK